MNKGGLYFKAKNNRVDNWAKEARSLDNYLETCQVMNRTAVVLHKGALAHYTVCSEDEGHYEAHLVSYKGAPENEPPQDIEFSKEGRHCTGSTEEQDLMDDICHAVQFTVSSGGSEVAGF